MAGVEFLTPYSLAPEPDRAWLAKVASASHTLAVSAWNRGTPFDPEPEWPFIRAGAFAAPEPVIVTMESILTIPAPEVGEFEESIFQLLAWVRAPLVAAAIEPTANEGEDESAYWGVQLVPPYGGAFGQHGHALIVMTPPPEFVGLTVALRVRQGVLRLRSLNWPNRILQ